MASRDAESIINCGYARVSIRTLTRSTCDKNDEKKSKMNFCTLMVTNLLSRWKGGHSREENTNVDYAVVNHT